ncbi:hypothetical protein GDO78_016057, partial [Eleutherodactylus coqui]
SPAATSPALLPAPLSLGMELALPLSWYVCLLLSSLVLSGASGLRSLLATLQNESLVEKEEICQGIVLLFINGTANVV